MKITKIVNEWGCIYFKNEKGDYHKEDGPAVEYPNGYKAWFINGERHREDGPARITSEGILQYWLNDRMFIKEDWEVEVAKLKLKRIKEL